MTGLNESPKTAAVRSLDAHEFLKEQGMLDDHTPRDWYNRWIGQRPSMTDTWMREYWPAYFDDGPPEYGEPWKEVRRGLAHVIPQYLRPDL